MAPITPLDPKSPSTSQVSEIESIATSGVLKELALTRWRSSEPHVTNVIEPAYRLRRHKRAS
jgi:hypothetical protein